MGRRVHRVPYHLDAHGIQTLPLEDLKAILRGADDLVMRGGRTLLAKVLRGSRQRDVLAHGLDRSPVHGYFRGLSDEEVLARIDWAILHGYLDVVYDYRLPLLVFGEKGWAIERETYARELFAGFDARLAAGPPYGMEELRDRNRPMILRLLDLVEESGDPKYVPLLEEWARVDYRKVRERIAGILRRLRPAGPPSPAERAPHLRLVR